MIIVLRPGTTDDEAKAVLQRMEEHGLRGRVLQGDRKAVIHVLNGPTRPARSLLKLKQVQALVPTSGPRVRQHGRRFYPHHFIGWCVVGLIVSAILVFFAGYFPPGLGDSINLGAAPDHLATPWYLWGFAAFLDYAPGATGWALLGVLLALVFCLPLLDRSSRGLPRSRLASLFMGTLALLLFLYLSYQGGTA